MTNKEVLLLLTAERIASELSARRMSQQLQEPITELVERWYEIGAVLEEHPEDAESWAALLDVARGLNTMTD
ncbi:MAG TPA: hypothetical protein VGR43_10775 [Dehalococcoidia bacterium]|jgi:hypothetical protein|nr:hypothetical protein [Dehalococcoidia bacterium]